MVAKLIIRNIANNNLLNKHLDKVLTNENYAAKLLIVSNIAKDVVGNGFDIYKTIKNEKIPKDKRKFNAITDIVINLMSWTSQILLGFTLANKKFQNSMSKKLFGHLEKTAPLLFNNCKTGFAIASSLIISTVLVKRIVVPFVSVPIASWIKNKYFTAKQTNEDNYKHKDCHDDKYHNDNDYKHKKFLHDKSHDDDKFRNEMLLLRSIYFKT